MLDRLVPFFRPPLVLAFLLAGCSDGDAHLQGGSLTQQNASLAGPTLAEPTFPRVTFYVQDHSQGGSVGSFMEIDHRTDEGNPSERMVGFGIEGQPQHKLTFHFDAEGSTNSVDVYQLSCEFPKGAATSKLQIEARYEGKELEVWRDETHSMGLRPPAPLERD